MTPRAAASDAQIQDALAELPGWEVSEGKLQKTFKFKSFGAALGWMVSAGIEAEKMNHHPEWSNVYKTVDVTLTTHDADGLSALDAKLGAKLDALAGE